MPVKTLRISVLALRRPAVTKWGAGELRPCAVLPQVPTADPHTLLFAEAGTETWYLGGRDLVLYSGDTLHHQDNLTSGRPALWVALRGQDPKTAEIVNVTADPYEGEGYASDLDLFVEAVAMPAVIQTQIADFVMKYHVDIPFKKRKRSVIDPNAPPPRAPRILQDAYKWAHHPRKR